MAAVKGEIKMETNGPQNGPKDDGKPQGAGDVKFQGGPPHNQYGNRGRGGRGGRFNDRSRGNGRAPPPYNNMNRKDIPPLDATEMKQPPSLAGVRRQGPFQRDDGRPQRSLEDRFADRIATISGPTIELPPIDTKEKKFNGRCRLYIGNLTNDITKEEIEQLFQPFGETSEVFINSEKMFAFVRVDYRANAEKAKRELDGTVRKGRSLRVRYAPHSAAVRVKNLNQYVTNELLEWAFQVFGEIERAIVIADERGKSTGEGIVEFARKPGAMQALRRCTEGCYFITGSLRPVIVEPYDIVDDMDGYSEKSIFKKTPEFYKEREVGPRFGSPNSFEADYGARWKALADLYKQKEESLKREQKLDEEKLEAQMEYARYEHETEMLRQQLRQREQDKERQKREWELKERQVEESRRTDEELMRRSEELLRINRQEEDLRRRQQETTLFAQAHQLSSLLDQQEQSLGSPFEGRHDSRGGPSLTSDPKQFLDSYDGRMGRQGGGGGGLRDEQRGSRWGGPQDRRGPAPVQDDYPLKRRRF